MKDLLWQPTTLGNIEVRNRFVMPPMVTNYATAEGHISDRTVNYYKARAHGGVGLIVTEATLIRADGRAFSNQMLISDDKFLPGLERLARAVHSEGARIAVQLHHGGRMCEQKMTGQQPVGPSPIAGPGAEMPRELTVADIRGLIECYALAALRAKRAGFDGVELHAAHGYLIDQFISASSNKRQDTYGGALANRARFMVEIIRAIKAAAGTHFAVWPRINGKQYGMKNTTPLEEAQEVAKLAQQAGADAIHVSAGGPKAPVGMTTPRFVPAVIADLAEGVKKAVTIPVIAVGRFTPEAAEKMLQQGKADFIAIGKGLLADHDYPAKARAGKAEDINPCIICMSCLEDLRRPGITGIRCRVSPVLGHEAEAQLVPAPSPKKVLVVGGGAAGMKAAITAASRGHKVTLWEKDSRLGGQLLPAAVPPHKDRLSTLNSYLQIQMEKTGVNVNTGKAATVATILAQKPDVLVLATGATPLVPELSGLSKAGAVQAVDVLEGRAQVGNKVVIIGGEIVGCETAEFLASQGKKVTLVRRGKAMATGVGPRVRPYLIERLEDLGVTMLTGVTYKEANAKGLVITNSDGKTSTVEADTIVLAAGAVPQNGLLKQLKGKVAQIEVIGDCVAPRTIREAIEDGYHAGRAI